MIQLILHLFGDYVTQSHWMAQNKTKAFWPAWIHSFIYSVPFYFVASVNAWLVILITHFFIDRYRLARYVVYAKNCLAPNPPAWSDCSGTGYPSDVPAWLAVWLLIAADNTLHLMINYFAIRIFG
jgi:hypothetical protein